MLAAPIPDNDSERLDSLRRMDLLSTPREADLDRLVRLARAHFDVEIALISLIDQDRQWFKARAGLDVCETGRDISFCGHAILTEETLVIPDAREDVRFADNPLVTGEPHIRFYAGQPLTNGEGFKIGTFCIISPRPKTPTEAMLQSLQDMAHLAETIIENRALGEHQLELIRALETAERDSLLDPLTGLWNKRGLDTILEREVSRAKRDGSTLSVAMAAIDDPSIGDGTIKKMAEILVGSVRPVDILVRYGEEFVMVMPGIHAFALPGTGEKLRLALKSWGVAASLGLTLAQPSAGASVTGAHLIQRAEEALIRAKSQGGDRIAITDVPDAFYSDLALA